MKSCYSPGDLLRVRGPYQRWNLPIQSVAPPNYLILPLWCSTSSSPPRHVIAHFPTAQMRTIRRAGLGGDGWDERYDEFSGMRNPTVFQWSWWVFPYIFSINYQMSIDVNTRWAQKPIISRGETTPLCVVKQAQLPIYCQLFIERPITIAGAHKTIE